MPKTETITWYTQNEAAKIFGVHPTTIGNWRKAGLLVGVRKGSGSKRPHWRFSDKAIKDRQNVLKEEARKKAELTASLKASAEKSVSNPVAKTVVKTVVKEVIAPKELDDFLLHHTFITAVAPTAIARDRATGKHKAGLVIADAFHVPVKELRKALTVHGGALPEVVMDYVHKAYGAKALFYWERFITSKPDNVKSIQEAVAEKSGGEGT